MESAEGIYPGPGRLFETPLGTKTQQEGNPRRRLFEVVASPHKLRRSAQLVRNPGRSKNPECNRPGFVNCRSLWLTARFLIPIATVAFDSSPYTTHAPDWYWTLMEQYCG